MNNFNGHQCDLKTLLEQWKLSHLLNYFLAQNIEIEILEMMKTQHISELLKHFPIGDRIRFEYELEKYRLNIGKPLSQSSSITVPETWQIRPPKNFREIETQTDFNEMHLSNENVDECKSEMLVPLTLTPSITWLEPPLATSPPLTSVEVETIIHYPRSYETNSTKNKSKNKSKNVPNRKLNALKILEQCKPRGPELLEIYKANSSFQREERVELINIFAHYFYEHSIPLPMQSCYELERQILNLFPMERLKDYRTEKRGKIYIRLSNIKNHRRRNKNFKPLYLKDRTESTENSGLNCEELDSDGNFGYDVEMGDNISTASPGSPPLTIYLSNIKQERPSDEDEEV